MAKIPGPIFILVGIAMTGFSMFVQSRSSSNMALFIAIGILFILFGVYRSITGFVLKDEEEPVKKNFEERQTSTPSNKQIISCSRCGVNHYINSNFCHMCGAKLEK